MSWLWLIKRFPKPAIVLAVVLISTGAFIYWWFFLHGRHSRTPSSVDVSAQVEKVRSRMDWLIVAGDDLYDVGTGELIFKNWLHGDDPRQLFYDAKSGKLIGQYEKGLARYALDGTKEAGLFQKSGLAFTPDYRTAVYVRDKDIWKADVDWPTFKLVNERKATSIGTFNETYFTANILLTSGDILVVRNLNQLLGVNLVTGEVKPTKIPLQNLGQGCSPDGHFFIGDMPARRGRLLFVYDVEKDEAQSFEIGRNKASDFVWLDNDRCIFIVGGKSVTLYDRRNPAPENLLELPFLCNQMGEPSSDGKFIFCLGPRGGAVVDLEKKAALPLTGGSGFAWVNNDSFVFSRDVQDSELRGIWLQTVGESERRVSPVPYLLGKTGGFIMTLPTVGMVIFATKDGLSKMNPDGTGLSELVRLPDPPSRVLAIQEWKTINP